MRKIRAVAAVIGTAIIGVLAWAAPAQATNTPKVATSITDVKCGTATINIKLADGVVGVYNARYYVDGKELGVLPSTGTTTASKTITLPEDSSGGLAKLWVSVVNGPKTMTVNVPTNCKPPVGPTVTSTGPTCTDKTMAVKVRNPNTLPQDKIQVRIGFTPSRILAAGETVTTTHRGPVQVWAGSPLKPLTVVAYKRPAGCPTATASASAGPTSAPTASPTATASPEPTVPAVSASATASPTKTVAPPAPAANSGNSGGGLPVTGTAVAGIALAGVVVAAAGTAAVVASRRRRTRFTA